MRYTLNLLSASVLFLSHQLSAQDFTLDWHTLAGGAGDSNGGDFALISTLGQPEAGRINGSDYGLEGGFLSIAAALQPLDPPLLRISLTVPNSVIISWPASASGWVLRQSSTLDPSAAWTDVGSPVVVNGEDNTVTQAVASGNRFYRLNQP